MVLRIFTSLNISDRWVNSLPSPVGFFYAHFKTAVLQPPCVCYNGDATPYRVFSNGKEQGRFFISTPADLKTFSMLNSENRSHDSFCDLLNGFFSHNDLPDIIEAINAANVSHISHPENDDARSVSDAVFLNTRATAFLLRLESAWRNVNPKNVEG